jgi:hypothetical protein
VSAELEEMRVNLEEMRVNSVIANLSLAMGVSSRRRYGWGMCSTRRVGFGESGHAT